MAKACVTTHLNVLRLIYDFLHLLRKALKENLEFFVIAQPARRAVPFVGEVHSSEVLI